MRPPAPEPSIAERSMPCSLARRRTRGEEWMRSVEAGAAAAAAGVGDGTVGAGATAAGLAKAGAGAGAGLAGAGAATATAAPPAPSITATMVWIGTVWPSGILISLRTPAEG